MNSDPPPQQVLGQHIEIHRPDLAKGPIRHAVLDFDGTLSLLRAGWQDIMVQLCVETLGDICEPQEQAHIEPYCRAFIDQLTGKPTIEQMRRLEEEVKKRGGEPFGAEQYKEEFLQRLANHLTPRKQALQRAARPAGDFIVPGSLDLLRGLARRGTVCHLASGTDHDAVVQEGALLGLSPYFEDRIYGARPGPAFCSKETLIAKLVRQTAPASVAVFGDGPDEISNGVQYGATTVGAATKEAGPPGWDRPKKTQLRRLGAHILVPDWGEAELLLSLLFGERN